GLALDGARRYAERLGDLRHRQVAVVPEDDDGSLPWRQRLEQRNERSPLRNPVVVGAWPIRNLGHADFPAPRAAELIQPDSGPHAAHVRIEVLGRLGPPPMAVQLQQRDGDEVVGGVPVPAEQIRRAPQPIDPTYDVLAVRPLILTAHRPASLRYRLDGGRCRGG